MVDTRPFEVGKNLAATPGAVVFRNEVLELIQYHPTGGEVHQRPLVIVPPQVNKFYVLDLAPGRSLAEAAIKAGHQVFMVSWRNPGPDQREWTLDTYVSSLEQALDAALDITGQPDLNILGACAGGITSAAMAGHLAALGDRRVNAMTFLVTALDSTVPSTVSTFASGPAVAASARRSRSKGVLEGRELASMFAWLRPNDLVWNYWVNNYLLGKNPPAFDILAWNADATNVPAGLHGDFLTITSTNALAHPGHLEVLGSKVDLGAVTCDTYVVGGLTDHIIPWQACYESMKLVGGETEFVLCKSGHIQTLVCPTDNAKAAYLTSPARPASADDWMATADEQRGSWWTHWLGWLSPRAGDMVGARAELGSANYPAGEAAPGSYVLG
jgi:polyhydroxyalkanoate synthase